MITVAEARARAAAKFESSRIAWAAAAPTTDQRDLYSIALRPPTEAEALAHQKEAERWANEWRALATPDGVSLEWDTRAWRSIGRQEIPLRLGLRDADAIAGFVGDAAAREWRQLLRRFNHMRSRFGNGDCLVPALRKHGETIRRLDDGRFDQVIEAAAWLVDNPVHGLRPRQLPIRGVDTKWFAAHRAVVMALVGAATGEPDLGIVDADHLVRIRVLDDSLIDGGPRDFAAPARELAAQHYAPEVVVVIENLECVLALPPLKGVVAVHGSGYAVDVVARLPWVAASPVLYWGDLDSDGFAILHRIRSTHSRVRSVLMDEETLLAHRDLWVTDPSPSRGTFPLLTPAEQATLRLIRDEGDVRLEQERIPWDRALAALENRISTT